MPRYVLEVYERWSIEADSPEQATEKWEVIHENHLVSETSLPEDWWEKDDEIIYLDGKKFAEEEE
jgi:hypothetical protein